MSSQYFPSYVVSKKNNIKVVLNLSGYAKEDDLDSFKGKNFIERSYLVFVPMNKYLNKISNTESILSWKSMGVSDDVLKPLNNSTLVPKLVHRYSNMQVSFNGSCHVKENKSTSKEKVLNIYIVYHLDNTSNTFHPSLKNCLFGSVKVTKKSSDFNGQELSGYGIAFYTDYVFTYSKSTFGYNAIVFNVDSQEDNNVKFNNKTINVKAPYKTNISTTGTKIVLSLHYNKQNSYIFANGNKITDFTATDSEINSDPICLGNIPKKFSESDTKKKQDCMDLCITSA